MTAPLLADALGPRGRRRVLGVSIASGLVIAGLVAVAVLRLLDKGQLAASRWEPLTRWSVLRFLLGGLVETLKVASVAMVLAMAAAAPIALARLARTRVVRWPAVAYIEFFRGVPLLLLILFIAFEELLRRSRITGEFFGNPLQAVTFVAAMYIAVNFTLSRVAHRLEVRQRRRYKAGAISVTGAEDLTVVEAKADAATTEG